MTTFTAGEVRELVGTEDIIARARVDKMLRAYADLLEAREKAVPVAFRYQAQQVATGAWVWSGWLDLGDPGIASLHVHCKTVDSTKIEYAYAYAPPSDTERLAEALRAKIRRLRNMPNGEFQLAASIFADDLERILAAHSAQAQPPAANVPDIETMVNRFLSWRLPKPWNPDNGISYTRPNYAHEPAEHDWPTGTNLFDAHQAREMIEYMLAAQENHNG